MVLGYVQKYCQVRYAAGFEIGTGLEFISKNIVEAPSGKKIIKMEKALDSFLVFLEKILTMIAFTTNIFFVLASSPFRE
jgi:hypothetical protein